MPVHTTAVVGAQSGVAALAALVARVEAEGERVTCVTEQLGHWVVVTAVETRPFSITTSGMETR